MVLLIDGNSLLNVTASVVLYTYRSSSNFDLSYVIIDGKTVLKESSSNYFKNFILKYINSVVIPLRQNLTEIYFVFDQPSWRKFYIEKYFSRRPGMESEFAYKGNRKEDANRKELSLYFDYFREEIMPAFSKIPGIHNISCKGAEGDDVLAVLCNDIKDDKLIWSGDSDINQLACDDVNGYAVVIGPKSQSTKLRKLAVPPSKPNLNFMNFSVDSYSLRGYVKHLATDKEYDMITVNSGEYVLGKIIMGDKSDNIPSIYMRKAKNGSRTRITELRLASIMQKLLPHYGIDEFLQRIDASDASFIDCVVKCVAETLNATECDISGIRENFVLNSRLIRLNMTNIPQEMIKVIRYKRDMLDTSEKFDYARYMEYAEVKREK